MPSIEAEGGICEGIRANSILPGMMNTPMVHTPGCLAAYGGSAEERGREPNQPRWQPARLVGRRLGFRRP
jgi:hypothetical protein